MPSNKSFGQQTNNTHTHLKVTIVGPVFLTIQELHAVELWGHDKVIPMRFVAENISMFTHPGKQLDQPAFIIYLLAKLHERQALQEGLALKSIAISPHAKERTTYKELDIGTRNWNPKTAAESKLQHQEANDEWVIRLDALAHHNHNLAATAWPTLLELERYKGRDSTPTR